MFCCTDPALALYLADISQPDEARETTVQQDGGRSAADLIIFGCAWGTAACLLAVLAWG